MTTPNELELIKRVKALSEIGMVYAVNGYDRERYEELRQISLKLMERISGQSLKVLEDFFMPAVDYPTVKVDVRAFVLNQEGQILMAKESVDGKWALPGGWADVGDTPSEAVIKEILEETGLTAEVQRLLAVYDKKCHAHPPQPFYVYKMVFLCKVDGGTLNPGFDMQAAAYFSLDQLPELSEDRILESQLEHLFQLTKNNGVEVYFD